MTIKTTLSSPQIIRDAPEGEGRPSSWKGRTINKIGGVLLLGGAATTFAKASAAAGLVASVIGVSSVAFPVILGVGLLLIGYKLFNSNGLGYKKIGLQKAEKPKAAQIQVGPKKVYENWKEYPSQLEKEIAQIEIEVGIFKRQKNKTKISELQKTLKTLRSRLREEKKEKAQKFFFVLKGLRGQNPSNKDLCAACETLEKELQIELGIRLASDKSPKYHIIKKAPLITKQRAIELLEKYFYPAPEPASPNSSIGPSGNSDEEVLDNSSFRTVFSRDSFTSCISEEEVVEEAPTPEQLLPKLFLSYFSIPLATARWVHWNQNNVKKELPFSTYLFERIFPKKMTVHPFDLDSSGLAPRKFHISFPEETRVDLKEIPPNKSKEAQRILGLVKGTTLVISKEVKGTLKQDSIEFDSGSIRVEWKTLFTSLEAHLMAAKMEGEYLILKGKYKSLEGTQSILAQEFVDMIEHNLRTSLKDSTKSSTSSELL